MYFLDVFKKRQRAQTRTNELNTHTLRSHRDTNSFIVVDTHTLTCKLSSFTHPAHVAESLPELTERQNAQARTKPGQNKVGQKRAPHAAHVAPAPRTPPRAARRPPPAARRPRSTCGHPRGPSRQSTNHCSGLAGAQASSSELRRAQAGVGRLATQPNHALAVRVSRLESSPILPAGGAACCTSRETVTSSGERRPERILT